jgi:hypothetical protein
VLRIVRLSRNVEERSIIMNATATMVERPPRRGGLVGPAILIGLGIVFLLNNLGVLDWTVWETLLRLWPVLLIAIGLDLMIGRRSALGSLLIVALLFGVMAVTVWASGAWLSGGTRLTSQTISQPLGTATRADVDVRMGAGTLRVDAQAQPAGLIEGTVAQGPRDQVMRDFSVSGDTATFKLYNNSRSAWGLPFTGQEGVQLAWDLRLNPDTPTRLHLDTGAGMAILNLARLRVTDLEVNTGVGQTTLTLPQQGRVQARINGGIGETTVIIPAGMSARIEATTGLGQVSVLGNYQRQDKVYIAPNYATADDRVDLIVKGGIGSITIRQESGR